MTTDDPWGTPQEGEVHLELARMVEDHRPGVLATVVRTERSTPRHPGSKMIVHADGRLTGSVGGGAAEAHVVAACGQVVLDGECRMVSIDLDGGLGVCGGRMEVFLEPVLRSYPFLVIGAGHVGRALAEVGRTLPFRFLLVDDRAAMLADLPRSPAVRALVATPDELRRELVVDARGAVLVASRGHRHDADFLEAVFDCETASGHPFAFLGLLGSHAKTVVTRQELARRGVPGETLDRLRSPVGLDLGDETPAEIAISVLAEALAVLRGREFLRDADGRELGVRLRRRRGS